MMRGWKMSHRYSGTSSVIWRNLIQKHLDPCSWGHRLPSVCFCPTSWGLGHREDLGARIQTAPWSEYRWDQYLLENWAFFHVEQDFYQKVWFKNQLGVLNTYLLVKNLITNIRSFKAFQVTSLPILSYFPIIVITFSGFMNSFFIEN